MILLENIDNNKMYFLFTPGYVYYTHNDTYFWYGKQEMWGV